MTDLPGGVSSQRIPASDIRMTSQDSGLERGRRSEDMPRQSMQGFYDEQHVNKLRQDRDDAQRELDAISSAIDDPHAKDSMSDDELESLRKDFEHTKKIRDKHAAAYDAVRRKK